MQIEKASKISRRYNKWFERWAAKSRLKEICKEYKIRGKDREELLIAQTRCMHFFQDDSTIPMHNRVAGMYFYTISTRLGTLHNEFLTSLVFNLENSVIALTRQVVELLITILYVNRVQPNYKEILVGKRESSSRPKYGRMLKEIAKHETVEDIEHAWSILSSMIHPAYSSFKESYLKQGEDNVIRNARLDEEPDFIVAGTPLPFTSEVVEEIVFSFYGLLLRALVELNKENKRDT